MRVFFITLLLLLTLEVATVNAEPNVTSSNSGKTAEKICSDSDWQRIKKQKNNEAYKTFIMECPDSRWIPLARYKLAKLEEQRKLELADRTKLRTKHDGDW